MSKRIMFQDYEIYMIAESLLSIRRQVNPDCQVIEIDKHEIDRLISKLRPIANPELLKGGEK